MHVFWNLSSILFQVRPKESILQKALSLGFSHCGFAKAEKLESLRLFYIDFIKQNRHAELDYLKRYTEQRINPDLLLPGVKSVIALLMNYFPPASIPEEDNFIISKYAYGKDDHIVVKERVEKLALFIAESFKPFRVKSFFDSGPVAEKIWAQRCGVGWQGKNTLLINRKGGSFYHIGIILTDLNLYPDEPETDHCGSCDKCINACPTGALNSPYQLDITRCLSYHTIENKGDIPVNLKGKYRHRIYGCDICQDICPYNRFARPHTEEEFLPSPELMARRKKEWLTLTEEEFDQLFGNSSVKRIGFDILKRNMELAGEIPDPEKS